MPDRPTSSRGSKHHGLAGAPSVDNDLCLKCDNSRPLIDLITGARTGEEVRQGIVSLCCGRALLLLRERYSGRAEGPTRDQVMLDVERGASRSIGEEKSLNRGG
jgi:hypothetical protein